MPKRVHTEKTNIRGEVDALRAIRNPLSTSRIGAKKYAALALCVSLWMASGIAEAAEEKPNEIYINNANQQVTVEWNNQSQIPGTVSPDVGQIASDKTLTVTGDWDGIEIFWDISGGKSTKENDVKDVDGFSLILDGAKNVDMAYGGFVPDGYAATVSNNFLLMKNSRTTGNVAGGFSQSTPAVKNHATLTDSTVEGSVYGGCGSAAIGNTVTLTRSKVTENVYGGCAYFKSEPATGNTVSLTNATIIGTVYGGYHDGDTTGDLVTGNTLNLFGANSAAGIQNFETINITGTTWDKPVLTLNGAGIMQNKDGSKAKIALAFENPETIPDGAAMNNLIQCENEATITADLVKTSLQEYTTAPVTGVLVNGALQGSLSFNAGNTALICNVSNKATKLTFTDVEWKDTGALLDHGKTLTNLPFNNAAVDTSNINFTNIKRLDAGRKMTLVSGFGDNVGTTTGAKYRIGTTLEGKGKASLVGNDLIFTAETVEAQEQTHNTVMGAEVAMAALSVGNDFVGAATEGLALASNIGADGVSSFAQMGGGSMRQETGSHVDTHTWNAIIALGHQNKKERGTFEYGAFFEYGTGNYSTFNGDERGDGSMHYTGGGLLAKYTMKNDVYVEGSLRAGSVHDDARNVLRDFLGTPYSYTTNAPYMGFHLGVGKEIACDDMHSLDVYGKYFFNRRKSVSFDAGGHYDLDAVTSSVLRVGARYTMKRDKWNFYGGLTYEHELDGEATGTVEGVAIRSADIGGGSVRAEIGATMKPGEHSPWSLDLSVAGYAGKKQGVTGGVSVAFTF